MDRFLRRVRNRARLSPPISLLVFLLGVSIGHFLTKRQAPPPRCPDPVLTATDCPPCPPCPLRHAARPAAPEAGGAAAVLAGSGFGEIVSVPRVRTQAAVSPLLPIMGKTERTPTPPHGLFGPEQALLLRGRARESPRAEPLAGCAKVDIVATPVAQDTCLLVAPTARASAANYYVSRHARTGAAGEFQQVSRFYGTRDGAEISSRKALAGWVLDDSEKRLRDLLAALPVLDVELGQVLSKATAHLAPQRRPAGGDAGKKQRNDKHGLPVLVMAVNPGAVNMLLNFICSARRHHIDIRNLVVFVTDASLVPVVEGLGATAYLPTVGLESFPTRASDTFGDAVFARMMWLKVLAAFLPLRLGYDVLFQDADHVWLKDPWPYFAARPDVDAFFMDDGSREARFAPYFANSGFYFWRYNPRTYHMAYGIFLRVDMLKAVRSHQFVVNQVAAEAQSRYGTRIEVLDKFAFVPGQQFHRNKTFMADIKGLRAPGVYLMHMCWTKNSTFKVRHFRDMNMWYVDNALGFQGPRAPQDVADAPPHKLCYGGI